MRLHTSSHTYGTIHRALEIQQGLGNVARHVHLFTLDQYGSRSHERAFEIRLATYHKVKGDKRYHLNTGRYGADSEANGGEGLYSATYAEWGWFIAQLFDAEPEMKFGQYKNEPDFHTQTKHEFALDIGAVDAVSEQLEEAS